MLVHRRVTPSSKIAATHLYTWVERGTVRVKCLAQEHNAAPRPGLEPGPFDSEANALIIRPPRLPLLYNVLILQREIRHSSPCFSTVSQDIQELFRLRQQEHTAWQEELFDGISAVLLGTEENVSQEDELLKALEDKYDVLRDKLLLEALEKQMGAAEWAKLSEQERQARLAKLKLQERRLRQQGRFDDAAALLGEGLKNAETLQVLPLEQI